MVFFSKFLSRSIHDDHEEHQELLSPPGAVQIHSACKSLTVWRKSLIVCCSGFTVIDSDGNLVYRVDNYDQNPEELILMNGSGKSIFTLQRHKKPRLRETWDVDVDDENGELEKLVWRVKKGASVFTGNPNVLAYVYKGSQKCANYVIKGSYAQRSCKVVDEVKRVVAGVMPKHARIGGISFGVEVFLLVVHPGFDSGFAMALLVLLDQMFS